MKAVRVFPIVWAIGVVPALIVGFIIWANATVFEGSPPFLGWKGTAFAWLFGVGMLSGASALAAMLRGTGASLIVALMYLGLGGPFLLASCVFISIAMGDIG
jgi:hypothetical protein